MPLTLPDETLSRASAAAFSARADAGIWSLGFGARADRQIDDLSLPDDTQTIAANPLPIMVSPQPQVQWPQLRLPQTEPEQGYTDTGTVPSGGNSRPADSAASWPVSSAEQVAPAFSFAAMPSGGSGAFASNDERLAYVADAARRYGHDPSVAQAVARSEGAGPAGTVGDQGTSFGAFQAHVGGGQGDDFRAQTGLDPSDPANERALIDWQMGQVGQTGWQPFHGASAAGIAPWQGVGTGQMHPNAPQPTPSGRPEEVSSSQQAGSVYSGAYTQQNLANAGDPDAWSKCGPVAALQFAQAVGRNPTPAEVERLARDAGWTPQRGMAGFASEAQVLQGMGIAARSEQGVNWGKVVADVSRGNPVILQLPGHDGHYITAQGYDPQTGKIDFGSTVGDLAAAGHRTQFTPSELEGLGWGTPNASLYLDNPATPAPSVAAGRSTPTVASSPSDAAFPAAPAATGSTQPAAAGAPDPLRDQLGASSGAVVNYRAPLTFTMALSTQPYDPDQGPHEWRPEWGTPGLGVSERGPVGVREWRPGDASFSPGVVPGGSLLYPIDQRYPGQQPYDSTNAEGIDRSNEPGARNRIYGVPPDPAPGPLPPDLNIQPTTQDALNRQMYRQSFAPTPGDTATGADASYDPRQYDQGAHEWTGSPSPTGSPASPLPMPFSMADSNQTLPVPIRSSSTGLPTEWPVSNATVTGTPSAPPWTAPSAPPWTAPSIPPAAEPAFYGPSGDQSQTPAYSPPASPQTAESPLKPLYDLAGQVIGYVHTAADQLGQAMAAAGSDNPTPEEQAQRASVAGLVPGEHFIEPPHVLAGTAAPVQSTQGEPDYVPRPGLMDIVGQNTGFAASQRMHQIEANAAAAQGITDPVRAMRAPSDPSWRAQNPEMAQEYDDLQQQLAFVVGGTFGTTHAAGGAPEPAPPFFSQLQRTIEDKMPNRTSPGQVQGMLRNSPVKPDEIAWTGLDDWLREQGGSVTKQQVLDFLDQNQVRVEEVTKGGGGLSDAEQVRLEQLQSQSRMTPAELDEVMALKNKETPGATKFGQYTLPGSQNYRELLLTLPEKPQVPSPQLAAAQENFSQLQERARAVATEEFTYRNRPTTGNQALDTQRYERWRELDTERRQSELAVINAREALRSAERSEPSSTYSGPHWEEPNVLAHVRFNDRVAPDGAKVLNLEEVQSDWASAGRDTGFQGGRPIDEARRTAISDQIKELQAKPTPKSSQQITQLQQEDARIAKRLKEGSYRTPTGPFVGSSEKMAELATKRVIRYAAENGYDRITWPPGQVHADRYNLAQHVDELAYNQRSGRLTGATRDGRPIDIGDRITPDKLPDYVGQEVADRMLAAKPDESGWTRASGADLRVGGEGMKGFYDQILPSVAAKIGKKFGARVGTSELPAGGDTRFIVLDQDRNVVASFPTMRAADEEARRLMDRDAQWDDYSYYATEDHRGHPGLTVHSMDITPAMRESVMQQGQPLFAQAGPQAAGATDNLGRQAATTVGNFTRGAMTGGIGAAVTDPGSPQGENESDADYAARRAREVMQRVGTGALVGGAGFAGAGALMRRGGSGALQMVGPQGALPPRIAPPLPAPTNLPPAVQQAVQQGQQRMGAGRTGLDWLQYWARRWGGAASNASLLGPSSFVAKGTGDLSQMLIAGLARQPAVAMMRGAPEEYGQFLAGTFGALDGMGTKLIDTIAARGAYADPRSLSGELQSPGLKGLATLLEVGARAGIGAPTTLFRELALGGATQLRAAQAATDAVRAGLVPKADWANHIQAIMADVEKVRAGGQPTLPITQHVIDSAEAYAKKQTFTNEVGPIGEFVKRFASGRVWGPNHNQPTPIVSNFLLPYFNVPWNLKAALAEHSPIGLAQGIADVAQGKGTQIERTEKVFNGMLGSAVLLGMGTFATNGVMTGKGPSDQNELQALKNTGWQPYHTLVNGVYVPNRLVWGFAEPAANMAGDVHDAIAFRKPGAPIASLPVAGDALQRLGADVLKDSFMQPLADGLSMINPTSQASWQTRTARYAASQVDRFAVPYASWGRAIGTAMDPSERVADRGPNAPFSDQFQQQVRIGIGNRQGFPRVGEAPLPVAQNRYGQPIANTQQGLLAPFSKISPQRSDPLSAFYSGYSHNLGPSPSRIAASGETIPLTPNQQRAWEQYRGEQLNQARLALQNDRYWQSATPQERDQIIQNQFRLADTAATNRIKGDIGDAALGLMIEDAKRQKVMGR